MKLFDFASAPNPRRIRIFMAEKGIAVPTIQVNLAAGEQFSDAYRAINPRCAVPALALEDGTVIGEVLAIWRYLESIRPDPPLLGVSPKEAAIIAMWERRMELDGYLPAADAFRNTDPAFAERAVVGPHPYPRIGALAERGKARIRDFYRDLDDRLMQSPFVAGDSFSAADITALVTVDFATAAVGLAAPPQLRALWRWHGVVSSRPSASA